jgi:hypothetical protein
MLEKVEEVIVREEVVRIYRWAKRAGWGMSGIVDRSRYSNDLQIGTLARTWSSNCVMSF